MIDLPDMPTSVDISDFIEAMPTEQIQSAITKFHIIINAVNFETGKKFRMWNGEYGEAKDLADILGEKMGFTRLDWRAKTEDKRNKILANEAITHEDKHLSNAERNIAKRDTEGSQSWKEDYTDSRATTSTNNAVITS